MTTPLKIAFVNQPFDGVLPPLSNSIGLWTYEVSRRLAAACEVHVFGGTPSLRGRDQLYGRVHYHLVPIRLGNAIRRRTERIALFDRPGKPRFASTLYYLDFIRRVARDLQRIRPNIIHVLNFSQFVPVLRRLNPTSKIVLHMQCEWLSQMDAAMIGNYLEQADGIIGCSRFVSDATAHAFPHLAHRSRAVYNGVDADIFSSAKSIGAPKEKNREIEVLFVGRVSPEKGVHDLVRAFAAVVENHPNARLKVIGGVAAGLTDFIAKVCGSDPLEAEIARLYRTDYRAKLKNMIPPTAASRITFAGTTPNHQLVESYRNADLFVFPSAWNEPFGIPIIEAMACEKPVVATRSGGIPEIVDDNKTGLLVDRGNPRELGAAISGLLENPSRCLDMGRRGRARVVEHFSWDRITGDLLEVYCDLPTRVPALV